MKAAALLLAVATLSGCGVTYKLAGEVADAVIIYCTQMPETRAAVRSIVAAELTHTGHSIKVTCANDVQD